MEPAEAPLKFCIYTTVAEVEERFRTVWKQGIGSEAVFAKVSQGWFVHLHGSYEALFIGHTKPGLSPGMRIRITIERNTDAQP